MKIGDKVLYKREGERGIYLVEVLAIKDGTPRKVKIRLIQHTWYPHVEVSKRARWVHDWALSTVGLQALRDALTAKEE
jgi:hypothetical protein